MASIRSIKKDAQTLVKEIVEDCANVVVLHPEKKDETMKLIENVLNVYAANLDKINNSKDQKKAYFDDIMKDMLKCIDDSYEQLRNIINAK